MPELSSLFRLLLLGLSPIIGIQVAQRLAGETQDPLQSTASLAEPGAKHAITPELSQYITDLLTSAHVPGISLGVVHTSDDREHPDIELESWGRKTEEGNGGDLDPEVSLKLFSFARGRHIEIAATNWS